MQVRTCWMRIAKKTMRWIAAVAGFFLVFTFPQDVLGKLKRSIVLSDIELFKMNQVRLSPEVIPTSYHLELQPFIGNDQFKGRVKINVTWTNSSDTIMLNVDPNLMVLKYNVRITEASFIERELGLPLMDVNVARVKVPTSRKSLYSIHLEQILKRGSSCEVDISFIGNFTTDKTRGFFKNEYIDANGVKHSFVAMSLRLANAQNVFPCMDEPPYKAPFKLSVLRPKNMSALSNTPLESSTEADESNLIWDHFEKTPEMSTYQLALIVSDLESITPTQEINEMDGRKLEIKVWGRKEYLDSLRDVPNKVVRIMNYLQDYFNSSIILRKLDLVAVPSYNAAKASDSWGLMFFKESELSSPSIWNTAYELIYQWIGQYITPFRWSDAPINKALNSFLASMTTVDLNPEEMEGKWPMTMLYSLYYEFGKFEPFSRVAGMRDKATSAKTELVFRMFNYTLGKELFQKGVRNFIKQNFENNQRTFFADDIYSRLNDVVNGTNILPEGLTVNSIAGPWTNRDRVPLVTVNRNCEDQTISFTQKVYLRESPRNTTPKVSYEWDIPLVMMTQENLEFHPPYNLWLTKGKAANLIITDTTDENQFIIVNPEEIGMFPVNYDFCNWKLLSEFLQSPKREMIPPLTRAKLLHDSWNLAYSGELCFEIALNMTLFLKEERSHVVWEPVFMMIDHVGRRIEGFDVYPKFEAYIRTLLVPFYEELNETIEPDEPSWKTHMRGMTKNFLCRVGYEPCVNEAREQYRKWLTDEDPDKGNPVANEFICPVFKWGSEEEWEFGLQRVINFPQNSPERKQNERTYLLKSLAGCPKDMNKIERLLTVTIFDQNANFSDSDIQLVFATLSGGAAGYTTLFNFLTDNWDTIKQRFEDNKRTWYRIIKNAAFSFSSEKGLDLVRKLYESNTEEFHPPNSMVHKAFKKRRNEWNEKNIPVINSWLMENLPKEELEALQVYTVTTTMTPSIEVLA